jgi:hypothetical protein
VLDIIGKLYACFAQSDAMLCEINPLVVTPDGTVKALDAKVTVDDSALFRHADSRRCATRSRRPARGLRAREEASRTSSSTVRSASRATARGCRCRRSTSRGRGRQPANFCDLGGGGDAQGVVDALEVIVRDPTSARSSSTSSAASRAATRSRAGSCTALEQMSIELPIVVRLDGTNAEEGARSSRRRAAEPPRRADDARRGAARRGAGRMTTVWSARARRIARATRTRRRRPRPLVEWAEGETALDVATGGGHVARRLREAGSRSSPSTRARDAAGRRLARRALPFADGSFDVVVPRSPPHHFATSAGASTRWRACRAARARRRQPLIATSVEEAERLRDPTHVRNYSRGRVARSLRARASTSSRSSCSRRHRLEPWLARAGCEGDEARACGAARDRVADGRLRSTRIALKARSAALMAIVVDSDTRLVVQGLTGSEGRFHGLRNRTTARTSSPA